MGTYAMAQEAMRAGATVRRASWDECKVIRFHKISDYEFIPVDSLEGFIIEDCLTSQRYKAILDPGTYSTTIGGVFSTLKSPGLSNTYANLVCYIIVEPIQDNDWDFINLPILQPGTLQTCEICNLWINPKVRSTTPAAWSGADAEFRTWATV